MKVKATFGVVLLATLTTAGAAGAGEEGGTAVWIGGVVGDWSDAGGWTGGGPTDTRPVLIDGPGGAGGTVTVFLDTLDIIPGLTVGPASTLDFNNAMDLSFNTGPIVNDGLILLDGINSTTALDLDEDLTITGSGELNLANGVNVILGTADRRLTHEAGHIITGGGGIGSNLIYLDNAGFIRADAATPMIVNLRAETVDETNSNSGVMEAVDAGTLRISATGLDNTGGIIRAGAGSVVELTNAVIRFGSLDSIDAPGPGVDGEIQQIGAVTLEDVWNTSNYRALNSHDPVIVGTLTNHGNVHLDALNSTTALFMGSPVTFLTGTGSVTTSDSAVNAISGTVGHRLVHFADHTIEGAGAIGGNLIYLTNHGVIRANLSALMTLNLRVPADGEENYNQNLIEATDGATLRISATELDNSGGTIRADVGSIVELNTSLIRRGTLEAVSAPGPVDGVFRQTGALTLDDVVLDGRLEVNNSMDPVIVDTILNNDVIHLGGVNSTTVLFAGTPVTVLDGPGRITTSDSAVNGLSGPAGYRIVQNADHSYEGAGAIGGNLIYITNHGVIRANNSALMTINLRAPDAGEENQNLNLMQATNGATMRIAATNLDNTSGVIEADVGSLVELQGSTHLRGGILRGVEAPGPSEPGSFNVSGVTTFEDLTIDSDVEVNNSIDPVLMGSVVNDGTFALNAINSGTYLVVASPTVTLGGSGAVDMGATSLAGMTATQLDQTFINDSSHTIRGAGQLGLNVLFDFVNRGDVHVDAGTARIHTRNEFRNEGALVVSDDGHLDIAGGVVVNTAGFRIHPGREVDLFAGGTIRQSAGSLRVNGTLDVASSPSLELLGGMLEGTGVIVIGDLSNTASTIDPGTFPVGDPALSVGTLTIDGDATFATLGPPAAARLRAELTESMGNDLLVVTGTANLGGVLEVVHDPLPEGSSFTVLDADALTGSFECVVGPASYDIEYTASGEVIVTIGAAECLGDIPGVSPGIVDVSDMLVLLGAWGVVVDACGSPADFNADGIVDVTDLLTLLGAWGPCS